MATKITRNILALTLVVFVVGAVATIAAFGALSNSRTLQSYGTVKAINVGVYWNSGCTNVTSSIDWGILSPGGSKNYTLYIKNEGNVAVRLSLTTQNWSPVDASSYISLSWNREGTTVNSGSVLAAMLTMAVSSSISGITNFSLDIIITGTE